jgi:hypothetical protein
MDTRKNFGLRYFSINVLFYFPFQTPPANQKRVLIRRRRQCHQVTNVTASRGFCLKEAFKGEIRREKELIGKAQTLYTL